MALQDVAERVGRLETVLASFIQHSEETIGEIRQDLAEIRQRRVQPEKPSAKTQHSSSARDADIAEMREWRIQSQIQWAEITQEMGSFAEDIVAPEIRRIGGDVFGLGGRDDELFSAPHPRLRSQKDGAKMREFDYVFATTKGWVIVESMREPRLEHVDEFASAAAEAKDYFPQYAALPLYPVFGAVHMPDVVTKYCTARGIYAFGMGAETMQLLNQEELARR